MDDKPTSLNADGISEPFASDNVPWEEWSQGSRYGSKFRYLSGFGGANHVGVPLEELAPGMEFEPEPLSYAGGRAGIHP